MCYREEIVKYRVFGLRSGILGASILIAALTAGCPAPGGPGALTEGVVFVNVNTAAEKAIQDGTSWASAFAEIQDGIDAAQAAGGGEVWVAQGVYNEARHEDDDGSLRMASGVDVYGGFRGVELLRSARDWKVRVTVIEGAFALSGGPARHVVKGANASILDGFYITGGNSSAPGITPPAGAGLYNDLASPTVRNCTFTDNVAPGAAAVYNSSCSPQFVNCTFYNNLSTGTGGAVGNSASSPTFTGCSFINNQCAGPGGAIMNDSSSSIECSDTWFISNFAGSTGGAVFSSGPPTTVLSFTNCVFAYNATNGPGGAFYVTSNSLDIVNCTFYGNDSTASGGAIFTGGVNLSIVNSILWDNYFNAELSDLSSSGGSTTITNSCTQTGLAGTGNISEDPLFYHPLNADFRLRGGSPCVDSGYDAAAPDKDIRGVQRPQGSHVDMGAFERSFVVDGN